MAVVVGRKSRRCPRTDVVRSDTLAGMPDFTVIVAGHLEGLVACAELAVHGPLTVWPEDESDAVAFRLDLVAETEDEGEALLSNAGSGIAAMVAIGWGAWALAD